MSNKKRASGSDVLTHVAGNLRRQRLSAGLSQNALAEASGISRRMIIGVEGGDANISLSSLDKLAAALGVGFVDLVRNPDLETREDINEVTWRGESIASEAILLASAPATTETQMWLWALGPGDHYQAEPDPQGWHEMLFIIEGTLRLDLSGKVCDLASGRFTVFSTAQSYSYRNDSNEVVRFVRNVVS